MPFTPVLRHTSEFEDPFVQAHSALLTPDGVVWVSEENSGPHMILRAIDIPTDTVIVEIDREEFGLRGLAVKESNGTLYARTFINDPDEFLWTVTTGASVTEVETSQEIQITSPFFGALDSNDDLWMPSETPTVCIIRADLGTATDFSTDPIDTTSILPVVLLGNAGSIAGRIYFRSNTTSGSPTQTRGIGWIDISTGDVTVVYEAPGRFQPEAVIDPVGEFIYTMDVNDPAGEFTTVRKLDLDGNPVADAALPFAITELHAMLVDETGHLWAQGLNGVITNFWVFDTTTLAGLGALPTNPMKMFTNYNYAPDSILAWTKDRNLSTGDFAVYEISAPVAGARQPHTWIMT